MKSENIVFAFLALLLVAGVFYVGSNLGNVPNIYTNSQPPDHTISTTGQASMKVSPDTLTIYLGAETQEINASLSQSKNAEIMDRVKSSLISKGVQEDKIKTYSYNVQKVEKSYWVCDESEEDGGCNKGHYEYEFIGYKTVHVFSVETSELEKGGQFIDAAVASGANKINSVQFSLSDDGRKSYETQLLREAAQDAKQKAQTIASGLNVNIGDPTQVSQNIYMPRQYFDYSYSEFKTLEENSASAPTTPISSGEMEISLDLSASFEIK